jgi:hypothetical protein
MWTSNDGEHMPSPLTNPIQLHGLADKHGMLLSLIVDGRDLRVLSHGVGWLLTNELGHQGVSGEAWLVTLEDGSTWWTARDLMARAKWVGERVG